MGPLIKLISINIILLILLSEILLSFNYVVLCLEVLNSFYKWFQYSLISRSFEML